MTPSPTRSSTCCSGRTSPSSCARATPAASSRTAWWSSLLSGEPEYLDPLKDEAPVGWIVTGYPWYAINTPEHKAFLAAYQKKYNDYPRLGSVVGYVDREVHGRRHRQGRLDRYREAGRGVPGLKVDSPFGPFEFRASDHQATMGAYVGKLALKDGKRHHGRLQVCRRRERASIRRRGRKAAPSRQSDGKRGS